MEIKQQQLCGGNSHQRRKLRRYLNRVALPLVDARMPLNEVAKIVGVKFQIQYKHMYREGYLAKQWMYRKPGKVA